MAVDAHGGEFVDLFFVSGLMHPGHEVGAGV